LIGWIALLVSGLIGLRHFEWRQVLFVNLAEWESRKDRTNKLKEGKLQGHDTVFVMESKTDEPIDEIIANHEDSVGKFKIAIDGLEEAQINYASIQRKAFYVGIVSLVIARGWGRFCFILKHTGIV